MEREAAYREINVKEIDNEGYWDIHVYKNGEYLGIASWRPDALFSQGGLPDITKNKELVELCTEDLENINKAIGLLP